MQTSDRFFLCNGLKESCCESWNHQFKINKPYLYHSGNPNFIRLIGEDGQLWAVDRSQFEEIKIISIDKETGAMHCIRLDASRTPEIIDVKADIRKPDPNRSRKERKKKNRILSIKRNLSDPNLTTEQMNKLLDELNEYK